MNKAILVGRLTKDPDLRATTSGVSVASFTVACDRKFVKQGEERKADFINCIAWQKSAESISKYFKKGDRIALEGSIQVRDWTDNDGKKHYVTEVIVDQWEFAQSKSEVESTFVPHDSNGYSMGGSSMAKPTEDIDGFMPIEDDDLPF